MARFKFRLETNLRLAEKALETAQREFAQAEKRWQECVRTTALQQTRFDEAEDGQREAGRHRPEELGIWQVFVWEQRRRLRQCELEQREQELVRDDARCLLLETHREVEKFRRLKEKQAMAFEWAELLKEQKILDETGQILHWRQEKLI
ncbi:MAG: flagellar export protein FliJ [Bacillota bacterium]|nr:flagellar export protein FliJ [Bacillota bacterium]